MIIPAGYAQALCVFTGNGVPNGAAITFGIDHGVEPSANDVADRISTHVGAWVCGLQSSEIALTEVQVKFGPNNTGLTGVWSGSVVGGDGAGAGAAAVALLVQKRSDFGGRKNRGRFFIPGIREARIEPGGHVDPTFLTSAQTSMTSLKVDLNSDGLPMVILHNAAGTPTAVESLNVQSMVATQRRRQRR